jgi:hypothetical protein
VYKIKVLPIPMIIFFIVSASIASNTIYVAVNGPNDPGSGTYADPFRRIRDAINTATKGDIVQIEPGIYTGPGNYNLDPKGKSITICSSEPNNPSIIEHTIIDPNKAGRGFYFHSGEDANCIISGLTIRNAYTGGNGGGIFCYNSSPTITNCVITGNSAGTHGGGLFCQNSNCTIVKCVIENNSSANDGGGIECWRGKPVLTNCIIANNFANGAGGGADYFDCDNIMLKNCTFAKNSADSGGALSCWGSSMAVNSCIFWANQAAQGSQVALQTPSSSVVISYSDVEGGASAVYDPCNGSAWGTGNIDANPYFASFDPNGDPNIWDFHLQSAYGRWDQNSQTWLTDSNTSLCIDAGDPNSDWSSEPWPNGKRINIGAYGGTTQASKNGNPADFNIDNSVNFVDFAQIASQWLVEQICIEDLNNDGEVNFADIHIFVENWLWEKN